MTARDVILVASIYGQNKVKIAIDTVDSAFDVLLNVVCSLRMISSQITTEDPEARLELLTGSVRGETAGWSKSFFKEISDSVGEITYFMYVLVK